MRGSPTGGGRERRLSGHDPRKRGINTKLHLAADAHGMPVRAFVTRGATADCTRALALIDGFAAERLLADRGRNTDGILARAENRVWKRSFPRRKAAGNDAISTGSLAGPGPDDVSFHGLHSRDYTI